MWQFQNGESREEDNTAYSVSIKVPVKQELLNCLPFHMEKIQYNLKFVTGILASLHHSITVCIFREGNDPRLGIFMTLEKHPTKTVSVATIDANYVALDQANIEYSLSRCPVPKDLEIPSENVGIGSDSSCNNIEFWVSTCGWHDETAMIFLTFHVVSKYPPKIVNEEEACFTQGKPLTGTIDVSQYFLNEQFSDISIICQSETFLAHRLILASQVEYFERMLSANMKESVEGVIKIDNIEPKVCKELLRFIYQGQVENLKEFAVDLFSAADQYGMTSLKGICELHLYNSLNYENALQIYDLTKTHRSEILCKRAKQVILSNKEKVVPDAETLVEFTYKHPDLVFELLKMANE